MREVVEKDAALAEKSFSHCEVPLRIADLEGAKEPFSFVEIEEGEDEDPDGESVGDRFF